MPTVVFSYPVLPDDREFVHGDPGHFPCAVVDLLWAVVIILEIQFIGYLLITTEYHQYA